MNMDNDGIRVMRLTEGAKDNLAILARDNPEFYENPEADFRTFLAERMAEPWAEGTPITVAAPLSLSLPTTSQRNLADIQALDVHAAFHGMTPQAATDGLMWTWITHFWLHSYSLARWPRQTSLSSHILNHWFVRNSAGDIRQNNTAARTWWIAETAMALANASAGAFTSREAIGHFAQNPRHYHNMMDNQFTWNPTLAAEVLRALMKEAKGISGVGSDQLWKRLNLDAGTLILDSLSQKAIRERVLTHVESIMTIPEFVSDRRKLRSVAPMRVLSLGAGVQSTCLALMADKGEYGIPKPDFALFADTGWEPPAVYQHLQWLKSQLSYEVVTVSNGNIRDNILEGKMPDGSRFLGIPAYVVQPDGSNGILHRQCTTHYKTNAINDYLRVRLEVPRGRRVPIGTQVEMWLGISADESIRQKPNKEEWINKRYPLIELGFSRGQLLNWFHERYPGRYLPTSSCIGCPYHSDAVWKQLKESDPQSFAEAVFVDTALRSVPATKGAIRGDAYLHRSRKPLAEVDFSEVTSYDNQMLEECEGLCGI